MVAKRAGFAQRLGKSGLMQTGDLLLTFRSEWGGAGAYPNVQMGISHTGVAYVKDGVLHNIDNPLNEEYLGPGNRGELNGEHYRTLQFIHVIRPRNLTDAERANIVAWATRLTTSAKRVYPKELSFNQDYNAPKYQVGQARRVRQAAGPDRARPGPARQRRHVLLGVRLVAAGAQGLRSRQVRRRIQEVRRPVVRQADHGAHEGDRRLHHAPWPLVVRGPRRRPAAGGRLARSFPTPSATSCCTRCSSRTRPAWPRCRSVTGRWRSSISPTSRKLEKYYLGVNGKWGPTLQARLISSGFRSGIPQNYSPTSYLINTLLPANNIYRTMDYIATIVIE